MKSLLRTLAWWSLIVVFWALGGTARLLAQYNSARIDLSGREAKIELADAGVSPGKIGPGTWLDPENANRYLTADLPGQRGQWSRGQVSFSPRESGRVRVILLGPYVLGGSKTKAKPIGVRYDNVKVNGVMVKGGDFENDGDGWKISRESYLPSGIVLDEAGNHCMQVWHNDPAWIYIPVEKGKSYEITFDFMPVGELSEVPEQNVFYPLGLQSWANMGFADDVEGDGRGGWTDQGSRTDLRKFDPRQRDFGGIPFDVVTPEGNQGKACVIFKGEHSMFGVESIVIPVDKICNQIDFLNACAWVKKNDVKVARAVVTYGDGATESFDFVMGVNTGDWWIRGTPREAEVAWKAGHAESGEIGLYKTAWKLKREALVKSLTIRSGDSSSLFALVGVTAGRVYTDPSRPLIGRQYEFDVTVAAPYTVINTDMLKLEMRLAGGDADRFFDEAKYLKRLAVVTPSGAPAESVLVTFKRMIPPLLLIKTNGVTGKYSLKIAEKELPGNGVTPREGLKRILGKEGISYTIPAIAAGGLTLTPQELCNSKGVTRVDDPDSFFLEAVRFDDDAFVETQVKLEHSTAARLLVYSREPENFKNYFWAELLGQKVKVGGNYNKPQTFYWQGGLVVDVPAGIHTLRIFPSRPKQKERKNLLLGWFQLSNNQRVPYTPGLIDELNALQSTGVAVYHPVRLSQRTVSSGEDSDPYFSVVAADKTYPDLSYMTSGLDVVKAGFLKPVGGGFQTEDGKPVPLLWGCNITHPELYRAMRADRLGTEFFSRYIARIKSMGYDTIRIMPITLPFIPTYNQNQIIFSLKSQKPLSFDEYFVDHVHRLLGECHKNNLRLFYTLWSDNGMFTDLGAERLNKSFIAFFHPEAMARLKEATKLVLTTPNRYRNNITPVKDPTLSIIEIENERNFVEMWMKEKPADWRQLPEDTRAILYGRWADFLQKKYGTFDALKKAHRVVSLREGRSETDAFKSVEFPPVWDVKQWGRDSSDFKTQFEDLRVTSAAFGKETRSNPAVSDGLEFMYATYRSFLVEMIRFLRNDLGYKGIIYANGADTELHYSQRRAIAEVGDAVPGGTGYWNREGTGFLSDINWLAPLVYASNNGKPVISREYGANLAYKNCWWGNVMTATIQQSFRNPYLFNFNLSLVDLELPDHCYPSDAFEPSGSIDLGQDAHLYSHFANLASAIALRCEELAPANFHIDIGLPYDNTFYAAPFRGYNRLTVKDYLPFLYMPAQVYVFNEKYDGRADLVVNEPAVPAGDYSAARNVFYLKPHSALDSHGVEATSWLKDKAFAAEGFIDQSAEVDAFYNAVAKAGYRWPVTRQEIGRIWRSYDKALEIDTQKLTYRADLKDYGAFIGRLENGDSKMPRQFSASGSGDAWVFLGNYRPNQGNAILMAVMNGKLKIAPDKPLDYVFLASSDLLVERNGRNLISVKAGSVANLSIKTNQGSDLEKATEISISFFRPRSSVVPVSVTLNVKGVSSVEGCDRNGRVIGTVSFAAGEEGVTFQNPWCDGEGISYLRIKRQNQ